MSLCDGEEVGLVLLVRDLVAVVLEVDSLRHERCSMQPLCPKFMTVTPHSSWTSTQTLLTNDYIQTDERLSKAQHSSGNPFCMHLTMQGGMHAMECNQVNN